PHSDRRCAARPERNSARAGALRITSGTPSFSLRRSRRGVLPRTGRRCAARLDAGATKPRESTNGSRVCARDSRSTSNKFTEMEMSRRQFIEAAVSTMAASVLSRCASPLSYPVTTTAIFHNMRQYAKTPFARIAYVERGTGDAALFLHGFPLNGFQWRGALDRLSAHRRCVAPDFLGLGYTQVAPGQGVAPDAPVAMLVALLDMLSIATVDVVANDSGGAVAQLLVTRHPERV